MTVYNDTNTYWLSPLGSVTLSTMMGRAVVGNSSGSILSVAASGSDLTLTAGSASGAVTVSWSDAVDSGSFNLKISAAQGTSLSVQSNAPQGLCVIPDQEWM